MVHKKNAPKRNAGFSRAGSTGTQVFLKRNKTGKGGSNDRIGGFEGTELKFLDVWNKKDITDTVGLTSLHDPTTQLCLNAIPEGNGPSERVGRMARMDSLHIRGIARMSSSEASIRQGTAFRVIVFVDHQTNGAAPSMTDLLVQPTNPTSIWPSGGMDQLEFTNLEWKKRFSILSDKMLSLNSNTAISTVLCGAKVVHFEQMIDLKGLQVTFNGPSGYLSTVTDNSIHIAFVSNETLVIKASYVSRLRFRG